MTFLYITADKIGGPGGGSTVTYHESKAMQELAKFSSIEISCRSNLLEDNEEPWSDPWGWDESAEKGIGDSFYYRLAHFYAGTFSKTVKKLKGNGTKVSYTAAAHDIALSKKAHESMGIPFNYPHLTEPGLWRRYVQGYLDADLVICPSTHSADVMKMYGCKNVVVIPHGCEIPEKVKPLPKKFTVGYLGSFGPDKSVITLLQAWKKLNYTDATLILAGGDSTSPYVIDMIRNYGGGSTVLMGWVDNVADFYNQISVYVQPSVCLLPGSPVYSERGLIAIDELTDCDRVLVDIGEYRRVIKPLKRSFSGDLISIKSIGFGESLPMTPGHRVLIIRRGLEERQEYFLGKRKQYEMALKIREDEGIGSVKISKIVGVNPGTIEGWFRGAKPHDGHCGLLASLREDVLSKKPEWVPARDIRKGDVVLFPRIKEIVEKDRVELPKKEKRANHTKVLPDFLDLDEEALQFFGYYIAEGCASLSGSIAFCFHSSESNYVQDVRKFLSCRLGISSRVRFHSKKKSVVVWADSVLLSKFLTSNFGGMSHKKTIPTWVLLLPNYQLEALVRGAWRGDGSSWQLRCKRKGTVYSTVSKDLAYQMFAALVKLGYMPKLLNAGIRGYSVTCNGDDSVRFFRDVLGENLRTRKGRTGTKTYIDDDYYYMPITDVSKIFYKGDVFNLEVEGQHCYAAPFIVHNSEGFGIEVLEALSYGRPVICSSGVGAADIVKDNNGCGLTFPSGHEVELMDAINACHYKDDSYYCDLLGRHGREVVAPKYTWDKIRSRYIEEWRKML